MVRLIDVAKAAGVSHGTASNVFNRPGKVRPALRDRVREAAEELGYAGPDAKGKLLRDGKFNAIAVMPPGHWNVLDSLRNPVFGQFLQGVAEICDENETNLMVAPGTAYRAGRTIALVDCMIFSRVAQLEEIEAAKLRRIPFCVVDFDAGPEINSVRVDSRAGAYAAARHLIDLGHRRFAILSFLRENGPARIHQPAGPRPAEAAGIFTDQQKYLGYRDAFGEIGLDIDSVPMVQADAFDEAAPGLLLDLAQEATAILSMSVMQAVGIVREARRRGLAVPEDLSVVGYNDSHEARTCVPPLTTVDSLTREKGRQAARLALGNQAPVQHVLTPGLVVRGTTASSNSRK